MLDDTALDKYLYPTRSELKFVESAETMTLENYNRFLKARVNTTFPDVVVRFLS